MREENFTPQQSIELIQSMISKAKQQMYDNSIYFLVWGWLTFFGFIGQFLLKNIFNYEKHYLIWLIGFLGVAFSIYQGRKEKKTVKVSSYVDDSMKHLWTGMAICFFVLSIILTKIGWGTSVYPFFIMLYGLGTFISGLLLRFNPLVIGGLLAWGLAIGAVFVVYDYQMLFAAAAILLSYIIPAYLLRRRDNNQLS
jgi:hypothetical protein